jgi:serine/threonine-protein kinase
VLRDKWLIDSRISRGGVGTVYAATHKNNGSRAAIKVLHPEFSRDVDTRSRFLQEGYAANQVNHPGVVRILDDDTSEDGHAYLVMELLEGELLEARRLRKGGTLPLPDVYEVGEQLLDVLAAAHEKSIVHRDIKPDNLFVTHEGRLKVLDFGFAQMRSSFRSEQTATGFLLGTPGFMSPEQATGNRPEIDAKTDIWATGATLFTLLSGQPVHVGESAAEMLVAAANMAPRSLATVTRGLHPRLIAIVDRAVAFSKEERWPSARAMQIALREVSGRHTIGQISRRSIPDEVLAPAEHDDDTDADETDIFVLYGTPRPSDDHEETLVAKPRSRGPLPNVRVPSTAPGAPPRANARVPTAAAPNPSGGPLLHFRGPASAPNSSGEASRSRGPLPNVRAPTPASNANASTPAPTFGEASRADLARPRTPPNTEPLDVPIGHGASTASSSESEAGYDSDHTVVMESPPGLFQTGERSRIAGGTSPPPPPPMVGVVRAPFQSEPPAAPHELFAPPQAVPLAREFEQTPPGRLLAGPGGPVGLDAAPASLASARPPGWVLVGVAIGSMLLVICAGMLMFWGIDRR